jgi:membrane-associated PAP2 superfamily phosphatase
MLARALASRRWVRKGAILIAAAAVISVVFASGSIDLALAGAFYRRGAVDPWPYGGQLPWTIFYRAAPWITASLVLSGLVFLAVALLRRDRALQRRAAFVVLSVALGPGLLVNGVFKDHWNRPRPRDVAQFGGTLAYAPAPLRGEGGKSFPCGHCSVGFLYGLGWWLWQGKPLWAAASLGTGLLVGTALGVGRMAAGGHFASDIVWAALISFAVADWLSGYLLRAPQRMSGPPASIERRLGLPAVLAAFGGLAVLVALFLTAHGELIDEDIPLASLPRAPRLFQFVADHCDVEVVIVDTGAAVHVAGETHGFGLPGSRLVATHQFLGQPVPTLRYAVEQSGWFTDLDSRVAVRIPAAELEQLSVRVTKGNLSLHDLTRDHRVRNGGVRADLRTGSGEVRLSK